GAVAQVEHDHAPQAQTAQKLTPAQSELLKIIRDSTERFKDPAAAEKEGYSLLFGCVSGPDSGAMGLHYVNLDLVGAGIIDPTRPQIVIYEPMPDGKLKLIGADFLVIASQWDKAHPGQGAPQLMGQLFHYFESPNRFGLPAFYTLHIWAWKENPNGTFVNWHPNVSCTAYSPQ
ncbi:MAG TPA: hypothetical protein VFP96_01890, partial [Candidatus Acidoferrum sp.]|nr:hypothetical protein [Candidatus Acidoferrum sp.]